MHIELDKIKPNPDQPRRQFDEAELSALADSIKLHGLINPIAVEEQNDGTYLILDGERRWRASKLANLTTIEASVRPGLNGSGQVERMILATTANLQRVDLNPVEKAKAFLQLLNAGMRQAEIARILRVSTATVGNYLLILSLPENALKLIEEGKLPSDIRMVRALLALEDTELMMAAARAGAARKLGWERITQLCQRMRAGQRVSRQNKAARDAEKQFSGVSWNMIEHIGNPAMETRLHKAALATCKSCALYESASVKICAECPGVTLLSKLIEVDYGK